jgi:hypothetical protein
MRVRHRIGGVDDARQACHIPDLLEDLVVHFRDQALFAINHRREAHHSFGLEPPFAVRHLMQ